MVALVVVSVLVIPPLLVVTGTSVKVLYIVPIAFCMIILIRRFDGSRTGWRDRLAEAFGDWMARQISRTFGLKPRQTVTTKRDRITGTVAGTVAIACLVAIVYFTRSGAHWYGLLALAWLVAMVVTWVIDRPTLQSPPDTK